MNIYEHLLGFWHRLVAVADKSAILLIIPAALALYFIDVPMFKTLMQWVVYAPVLAGVAVIVSRVIFHRVNLSLLIRQSESGNVAAAIVVFAITLFVALIFMALVLWSKA